MRIPFFVVMIILNLLIGGGLGFLLTTYPSPKLPNEFIDLAVEEQAELARIDAEIVANELSKFESEALAIDSMLKEIFLNRSFIPEKPSYYHDFSALTRLDMSEPPAGYGFDFDYNQNIAYSGSSFQIAPSGFIESFQETYLNESILVTNPLSQVSNTTKADIFSTAKLDHILPLLYQTVSENTWLYYASEKGYTRNYPYSFIPKLYDSRDQTWYTSAATGAKDVVILLDKSGSMEGSRKEGAMNATLNIIRDLGGRDRFNIIGFSDRISQFSDSLELSSESNLLHAEQFLNRMISGGTTDYELAFETGMKILESYGSDRRQPVVLFITDGDPTIGTRDNTTLIQKLQELNIGIDAQFVFFGIGEARSSLLSDISLAVGGNYQYITNNTLIESSISSYHDFLSVNKRPALTWSLPKVDPKGQGLLLTVSYPVIINNKLQGVIGIDLPIESMINFTRYLQSKENTYSFIFDLGGTNIIHHSINISSSSIAEIRQPILELENPSDRESFEQMIRSAYGHLDANTRIIDYQGVGKVVSFMPIGNTSMLYGLVTPFDEFLPNSVDTKLGIIEINTFSFLPGVGLGILGSFVIYIFRGRLAKEDIPDEVEIQ